MGLMKRGLITAAGLVLAVALAEGFEPMYEREPIRYHETEPDTVVTRLFASAEPGGPLASGSDRDILEALLEALDVPVESQVLVFSKTSAQNARISPRTPRAIYFSDDVYVGWAGGGEIELVSFDERLGMVFHLVRLTRREADELPTLVRERSCLNCHAGASNRNFPGLMIRSVHAGESGQPLFHAGTFHTRQNSPIEERWGGWYVTGSVTGRSHMGNSLAREAADGEVTLEPMAEGDATTLSGLFDIEPYLRTESDVVALMTLEHQVGVHNALVRANLTTRATEHRDREMKMAFGESPDAPLSETNRGILENLADLVLREMLYVDEVELPGEVTGGSAFQAAFESGPGQNPDGASLRDFRLYQRLMQYRCSHLIYSDAFAHLPDSIRTLILEKLHGILTEPASHPEFGHLGARERKRIHSILWETMPDLPSVWRDRGSKSGP